MEDYTCEGCACEQDKEMVRQKVKLALFIFGMAAALGGICGTLSVLMFMMVTR